MRACVHATPVHLCDMGRRALDAEGDSIDRHARHLYASNIALAFTTRVEPLTPSTSPDAVKKFALPSPHRGTLGTAQTHSPGVSQLVRDSSIGHARRQFSSDHKITNRALYPRPSVMYRYCRKVHIVVISSPSARIHRHVDLIPINTCFVISLHRTLLHLAHLVATRDLYVLLTTRRCRHVVYSMYEDIWILFGLECK